MIRMYAGRRRGLDLSVSIGKRTFRFVTDPLATVLVCIFAIILFSFEPWCTSIAGVFIKLFRSQ